MQLAVRPDEIANRDNARRTLCSSPPLYRLIGWAAPNLSAGAAGVVAAAFALAALEAFLSLRSRTSRWRPISF